MITAARNRPPTAGEVRVHGHLVRGPAPNEIAYVFQENTLFPWNTILDNIKVALEFQGVPAAERQDRAKGVNPAALISASRAALALLGVPGLRPPVFANPAGRGISTSYPV